MDGVLGLDEILFFVPDVQIAKHWYQELLGSEPFFDTAGYCAFRLANATIGLHPADEKNWSGSHGQVAYWRVEDIEQVITQFERRGCTRWRGPIFGVDGVWVCQLRDPYGNIWGFVQRRDDPRIETT